MDPILHAPGEGERLAVGQTETVIKATAEATGGSLFLCETTLAPGSPGPPPHRHKAMVDMFYVLEGVLTMRLGDETREVEAGSFACAPPGVVHTFGNAGDAPVRFLNFSTPGGWEDYMRALSEAIGAGDFSPEIVGRIAERFDLEVVKD